MYQVINGETNEMVEEHGRPESAYRVMLICNAQAMGNGHEASYRCEPAIFPLPHVSDLNLPNWARKALGI